MQRRFDIQLAGAKQIQLKREAEENGTRFLRDPNIGGRHANFFDPRTLGTSDLLERTLGMEFDREAIDKLFTGHLI